MFQVSILVLLLFRGMVCEGLFCVFDVLMLLVFGCCCRLKGELVVVQVLFGLVLGCVVGILGCCLCVRSVVQVW